MRTLVLIAALAFIAMMAALTIWDVATYGLSPLDVVAVMILGLFITGILGALRERRPPGG